MSKFTDKTPEEKAKLAEQARNWRANNRDKFRLSERKRGLVRRYGITFEDFENLLKQQDNKCVICGLEYSEEGERRTLHVDHCHSSKNVRGLLCNGCNRGIGFFNDSPELLEKAAEYLRRNNVRSDE